MAKTFITNKERALRRMRALTPELKKLIQLELNQQAEDLVQLMRRRVPVDTGALQDSIRAEPGPREGTVVVKAGGVAQTRKRVRKGVLDHDFAEAKAKGGSKGEYDYARSVEFGTTDMMAQPFFYPSYRQKKKGIQRRVKAAARKGVAKAVTK